MSCLHAFKTSRQLELEVASNTMIELDIGELVVLVLELVVLVLELVVLVLELVVLVLELVVLVLELVVLYSIEGENVDDWSARASRSESLLFIEASFDLVEFRSDSVKSIRTRADESSAFVTESSVKFTIETDPP